MKKYLKRVHGYRGEGKHIKRKIKADDLKQIILEDYNFRIKSRPT
jgi:hypothetical protein